jgi:hypothetical protein
MTARKSQSGGGYKPRAPGSLKAATDRLIAACGGVEAAANLSRVGKSTMQRYGDAECPESYMPVDVVRALELHSGEALVTAYLAAELGCEVHAVAYDRDHGAIAADIARLSQDFGRLFADSAKALAMGEAGITAAQAGIVTADIDDAISVLFQYRAALARLRAT